MMSNSLNTSTVVAAALFGASVASSPDISETSGGLRNFGVNNERQLLDLAECYDCDSKYPCDVRSKDDPFYFKHCRSNMFVQCSEHPIQCWEKKCPSNTLWYQSAQTCCHHWDIACQGKGNREEGNGAQLPTETCSGYGATCGTKPCYNHQVDIWPPERKSPSWCESDEECESCCCGEWAGWWRVCTDSVDYGSGLKAVCLGK